MFAIVLFESGIWKALSFALMVIAVISIGYKELFKLKEGEVEVYRCMACGYIYDPKIGDPYSGIAPGTAFEDIPDTWAVDKDGNPTTDPYAVNALLPVAGPKVTVS